MNLKDLKVHSDMMLRLRSILKEGPWLDEPDRHEFEAFGLPCLMSRGAMFTWCGYVGLPKRHPLYDIPYHDLRHIKIHGGLTYSARCVGWVCHKTEQEGGDDRYWLGFDCGHAAFDFLPPVKNTFDLIWDLPFKTVYRDFEYTRRETINLAQQLHGIPQLTLIETPR